MRTGDIAHAIGGNGPRIVLRATGEMHGLETAASFELLCAAFEREVLGHR